ncbi:MAG: cyclic nucleotide-binding domain-containing protein [Phycisphaerales bacterium]|nr:MAG: cyclic nucleotide-binding domain-containing protein [Phycisphaerales bacterium]
MNEVFDLYGTPLFAGCSREELTPLAAVARHRDFGDGELVFAHNDEANDLMIIASGRVELELPVFILGQARNIPFETKGRGDAIGWSALVPPYRFTLSARVSGGADLALFPRAELTAVLESSPALGFRVMKNLAAIVGQRLTRTKAMWVREVQRSLDERYR